MNKRIYFSTPGFRGLLILAVCLFSGIIVGAQQCPPVIASLMPKNAAKITGQYNAAGMIGLGFGAADLPFDHPCITTTKFPGKVTFDIKHYSGEGVQLFQMQIGPEEQQRIADRKAEFEKAAQKLRSANPGPEQIIPFTMESVAGGTILYYGYISDCSEGVKRSRPTVFLMGAAHTGDTAINLEIKGSIPLDMAKSAAAEILGNFRKADFGQLDR